MSTLLSFPSKWTRSSFSPMSTITLLGLNTYLAWLLKSRWLNLYIKIGSSFLYLSFHSINLLKSVLSFEVVLILLSMTRSNIRFSLFSGSLNYLPSTNIKQGISFGADTPFARCFLTVSTSLVSNSINQNVSRTLFLPKEKTPKTFLLHRVLSLSNDHSFYKYLFDWIAFSWLF